jgi:hypothetical protein
VTRLNRPNAAAPWTSDDYQLLAELLAAGKSMREVAEAMGRSQEACRCKAQLRGLMAARPWKQG